MARQFINPPGLYPSLRFGFSQGVEVSGGTTVYLAGQVAWDTDQRIVGPGDLPAQTRQALTNIELALRQVGAGREHISSLRTYIAQDYMASGHHISTALCESFPEQSRPPSTWIGVAGLASEEFLVEIEAVAQFEQRTTDLDQDTA